MCAWQHVRDQPSFFRLQQGHGQGRRFSTRHILTGGGWDAHRGFLIRTNRVVEIDVLYVRVRGGEIV